MSRWRHARRAALALVVLAVALLWVTGQGISATASDRTDKVAAKSADSGKTVASTAASTSTTAAAPAPAPQPGQAKKQNVNSCTVNGKTYSNCPPALLKQAKRQAARQNAPKQKTGVTAKFAGLSPATTAISPLAQVGSGPVAPAVLTAGVPPDYFGAANYANSPLPQLDATGAVIVGTGMRKFVDALPLFCTPGSITAPANGLGQCIPIATPDTVTFPNSDFYRIGIVDYTRQMHSDLPGPFSTTNPGLGTQLKGYVQLDSANTPLGVPQYLGPVILATRNRPVRVLFDNLMTKNLNIPVDTTYMGAGVVNDGTHSVTTTSELRTSVHLHGGNTPWISDGTPHQWITPANDPQGLANPYRGFAKGFSFQNVPDMLGVVPNTPNDGMGTFYYTNQQSGRLMFYHEHAYGTTRLGVYNGLAAGYLIADPTEETALAAATAPGTIVTDPTTGTIVAADLTHVIPLVIQDKTFVPDAGAPGGQLAAEDPTWDLARGGYGDLWFPHVYMPNQNPADLTGANGFGRWDWGPWFWPPQAPNSLLAYA